MFGVTSVSSKLYMRVALMVISIRSCSKVAVRVLIVSALQALQRCSASRFGRHDLGVTISQTVDLDVENA